MPIFASSSLTAEKVAPMGTSVINNEYFSTVIPLGPLTNSVHPQLFSCLQVSRCRISTRHLNEEIHLHSYVIQKDRLTGLYLISSTGEQVELGLWLPTVLSDAVLDMYAYGY